MRKIHFVIYLIKSYLIMLGIKGRIVINFKDKFFNYDLFFKKNEIFFINFEKKKTEEETLFSLAKKSFDGVMSYFLKKVHLIGIGFRSWTVFEEKEKFLIVKTSLSKDCIFYIPKTIDVFCLSSTVILIRGVKKVDVDLFMFSLKKIKNPNFYKSKGIFVENEIMKVKIGKKM